MAFRFFHKQHKRHYSHNYCSLKDTPNTPRKDVPCHPRGYDDGDVMIQFEYKHVPEAHHHHHRTRLVDIVELPNNKEQKSITPPVTEMLKGGVIRYIDDAADGYIKAKHRAFEVEEEVVSEAIVAFGFFHKQHKQPHYSHKHIPNCSLKDIPISSPKDVPRLPSGYDDLEVMIQFEYKHVLEAHHHNQRARFVDFVELPDNKGQKSITPVEKMLKGGVIRYVDDAADGYIKAKHTAFEVRQWNTFKK